MGLFKKDARHDTRQIPLELMGFDELLSLKLKIEDLIGPRGMEELEHLKTKVLALAQSYGLTPQDLFGAPARPEKKQRKKREAKPKFRSPTTGEEWSGRGKQPRWLADLIEQGHAQEEYAIERAE